MTPTREQEDSLLREWLDAACLVWMPAPDVIEPSPGTHLSSGDVRQLIRVAWKRAHAAGRAQGLGEAVEVCKEEAKGFGGVASGPFATDFGKHTHNAMAAGAETCAAAIEQLKEMQ